MEAEEVNSGSWASLNRDVLERIGCELSLRELLSARTVCRQWHQHVTAAVRHLPHPHQPQQRHLVELDAQPAGGEAVWQQSLAALASCLPNLSEVMVYVSSRVSEERLGAQLHGLPAALTALTKLELRYIVPSSVPCLGTTLQQLQPSLTALTQLETLYLIMGASPEPAEVTAVLPALSSLRDLKLLSGLPQYGFTNAKLAALGCATQLQRLHLEVSGVGQVDAGLTSLSPLTGLRELWLDGLVTLGQAVVGALQQLPDLQELRLELDSPQHIPDLFDLPGLKRLSLTYHGDELDDADEAVLPPPPNAAAHGGVGGGGGSGTDWDALGRLVRGHAERPVLRELGLLCCSFPSDPLPRLALLTSLTSLSFYDCRWKAGPPRPAAAAAVPSSSAAHEEQQPAAPRTLWLPSLVPTLPGDVTCGTAAVTAAAAMQPQPDSWGLLTSLVGMQGFGMAQCVVPPISEFDLASLAVAWTGITTLQLQSAVYRPSELPLLASRPQPARFGAFLSRWRRLEALTLSGSWCNDPRVALDISLLPPSLTSLVVSSVTLINSAAAQSAILGSAWREGITRLEAVAVMPAASGSGRRNYQGNSTGRCFSGGKAEPPPAAAAAGVEASCRRTVEGRGAADGARPPQSLLPSAPVAAYHGDASAGAVDSGNGAQTDTAGRPGFSCGDGQATEVETNTSGDVVRCGLGCGDGCACRLCVPCCSRSHAAGAAAACVAAPAASVPELSTLEHLVLGEVRFGEGVSLELLVAWAPNLRSLEINNLVPNLTDDSCTALAALTALTVLRVSQDQDPESGGPEPRAGLGLLAAAAAGEGGNGQGPQQHLHNHLQQQRPGPLSGLGLAALTSLRNLRQLEWLPWGCEPLDLEHVEALAALRRLHLVTLRGARDGAIADRALEALRERLPLCDIDDTEWSGLVDV